MYLKRLELQGFKSFPERIKLEFNRGITAVVGPNGSGKSNISDAVRWVLGEQSAKSLRGSKMEDIIFTGTANRRALGFAEVSIIIDNEDKVLPLEYTEVTITRRVYRSGDSVFLINGGTCRLKDIHELFMDTGVGREGYSIIGQGQIESILSAKSEDRRALFEEAAGIVKYKNRREDSLSKLEREKQNLIRVTDIITELNSKLEPLESQAEKAKKYLSLTEKLKLIKINIFLIEAKKYEQQLKDLTTNKEIIKNQQQSELKNEADIESKYKELKVIFSKTDEQLKEINEELVEIRSSIEQKENDINLFLEKNNYIDLDIKRLKEEEEKSVETINNYEAEKKLLEEKLEQDTKNLNAKKDFLKEKEEFFNNLNKRINESQLQIDIYNNNITNTIQKSTNVKSDLQRLDIMYESFEARKEQIIIDLETVKMQILNNETTKKEFEKEIEQIKNSIIFLQKDIENLKEEKEKVNAEINTLKEENNKTNKALNEYESRYKIIKELEEDYEGYFKSIKAILKEKKKNKEKYKGIHGAVGELISVSLKYETAIEIALSSYVQNIVTETEEDAKIAISYLKSSKEGRATFLPLNVIKSKTLNNQSEIKNNVGVCGIAKDLISFDKKYENIMSSLLGRVVICDNMDNAIALSKKYNNTIKIVTLDGDLISSGGAMTGGSIAKKSTSIFSRSRQLTELEINIATFREKNKQLLNMISSKEKEISIIEFQLDEKRTIFHQRDIQNASINQSYIQTKEILLSFIKKEDELKAEDEKLMEQILNTNINIRKSSELISEYENEITLIKKELSIFQSELIEDGQSREQRINELTDIKVLISAITQDTKAILDNINRIKNNINFLNKSNNEFETHKDKNENNKYENNEKIISLQKDIERLKSTQKDKLAKVLILDSDKNNVLIQTQEMEVNQKEQRQLLSKIENEKIRLELKFQQVEEDNNRLFDNMWEDYEITYQQANKYEKLEDSIANLHKLDVKYKNEIKNLGSINVSAIEEYKEVKERFEFLTVQKNDIIDAEEKLKDIIFELTKLMEVQFMEQFKIISENFNNVYHEIFEGGKAYLQFSDSENILESGIDIIAKPPGKNLQNMNLLSGGERALTAIALLFAILKMKPSPFCILDEIESALDDANVKRYANYLKNFSNETQFILITHRKGTMVAADVLYGVTMAEQGVSKLVSVELI